MHTEVFLFKLEKKKKKNAKDEKYFYLYCTLFSI